MAANSLFSPFKAHVNLHQLSVGIKPQDRKTNSQFTMKFFIACDIRFGFFHQL